MAAVKAQQRGGLGWATQAADAGASGVLRRAFFWSERRFMGVSHMCVYVCTKVLVFGVVAACVRVACAHLLFWTLAVTWVCGSCVYGTVKNLLSTP